jgi:hypothetical protein
MGVTGTRYINLAVSSRMFVYEIDMNASISVIGKHDEVLSP